MTSSSVELVGRDDLIDQLRSQPHGVTTLRGPGGIGKTTLVRAICAERDGTFVSLEAARTRSDVVSALGESLGIPPSGRTADTLAAAVVGRLLVLDNAEQVRESLVEVVAMLPANDCWILVTSRRALEISGEQVVDVPGLAPGAARALFERCVARASPDHVPPEDDVDELLSLLDGLPLAIELAAARVRIMRPGQIVERLNERFDVLRQRSATVPRHAALDACVEWSWDLLPPHLRSTLTQLSVFRAAFSLEDAEAFVVSAEGWVGEDLEDLCDHSLVSVERAEDVRFRLYDHVRRFVERTSPVDPGLARRFAEAMHERVQGGPLDHREALDLAHAFELVIDVDAELGARLVVDAQRRFWRLGFHERLFAMIERALAVDDLDSMWKGAVHYALASAHYSRMEYARTSKALETAASLVQDDDRPQALRTRTQVALLRGVHAHENHDLEAGKAYFAEARQNIELLPLADQSHAYAATTLGAIRRGEYELAVADSEASIRAAQRSGDRGTIAGALSWSANAYVATDQPKMAVQRLEQALEIYRGRADVVSRAVAEYGLALVLAESEPQRALEFAELAAESARQSGLQILEVMTDIVRARLQPSAESAQTIRRRLRFFDVDSARNERWSGWLSLVTVLVRTGDFEAAAQECEFWLQAVARLGTEQQLRWTRRYHAVTRALCEGAVDDGVLQDDPEFREAVVRGLQNGVDSDDLATHRDAYMHHVHDGNPSPLELFGAAGAALARPDVRFVDDELVLLAGGTEIDLATKFVLKRLFRALCESHEARPGESMTVDELIHAGWPDERMTYESGVRRVYSAIRNLRKAGLEEVIKTGEDGYLLDPNLTVVVEK